MTAEDDSEYREFCREMHHHRAGKVLHPDVLDSLEAFDLAAGLLWEERKPNIRAISNTAVGPIFTRLNWARIGADPAGNVSWEELRGPFPYYGPSTIRAALNKLRSLGFIDWKRGGKGRIDFRILPLESWKVEWRERSYAE